MIQTFRAISLKGRSIMLRPFLKQGRNSASFTKKYLDIVMAENHRLFQREQPLLW